MTTSIKKLILGDQGLLVIFILAFALVSLTVPNFLTERNMLGLLQSVVTVGVIACTMMFCLAARDFDLSVGSMIAVAGMVGAQCFAFGTGFVPAVVLTLAAGALMGLFNGALIAKLMLSTVLLPRIDHLEEILKITSRLLGVGLHESKRVIDLMCYPSSEYT